MTKTQSVYAYILRTASPRSLLFHVYNANVTVHMCTWLSVYLDFLSLSFQVLYLCICGTIHNAYSICPGAVTIV